MEKNINAGMLPDRITPSLVNVLADGEIFVFGSNIHGAHMGGAARTAMEKFGAVWGMGEGLQGRSYAIPTMEGLDNLAPAVQRFTSFARQHQELKFLVTAIGCGIAGYQAGEIAPMFLEAARLPNVFLPMSFWEVILHDRITRILQMEEIYDRVRKDLATLKEYEESGLWLEDYEADERGEVPSAIKRGVLSQDGLDDLFDGSSSLKAPVPGFYRHFRNGKLYRLIGFATIEATEEEVVVYQAMNGDHRLWVRPKANFFESVMYEGNLVPRFRPVQRP